VLLFATPKFPNIFEFEFRPSWPVATVPEPLDSKEKLACALMMFAADVGVIDLVTFEGWNVLEVVAVDVVLVMEAD
jgi:hypothetical protein